MKFSTEQTTVAPSVFIMNGEDNEHTRHMAAHYGIRILYIGGGCFHTSVHLNAAEWRQLEALARESAESIEGAKANV